MAAGGVCGVCGGGRWYFPSALPFLCVRARARVCACAFPFPCALPLSSGISTGHVRGCSFTGSRPLVHLAQRIIDQVGLLVAERQRSCGMTRAKSSQTKAKAKAELLVSCFPLSKLTAPLKRRAYNLSSYLPFITLSSFSAKCRSHPGMVSVVVICCCCCTDARMHGRTHGCTRTRTHTYTHTHIHT